ncbi:phage tail assembly chaperone family protein, TAC [Pseudomonas sp. B21-023]|uniref:phage tail assembly chaperone family protein, TAC n=1 Tax=unclassified Pseudomonas TaxID=196821 RepID=UPI001119EA2F|nr:MULTISPECIES: phage tail assembly chaperone family protein, TAC [unclassified Pseudomonas]MBI6953151.1 phage tail assembly chaperone family protein, TAC [Pseudomonas sp. CCOS 191]UVL18203.1 phage tail assembly chaperone family protein, TAC [Pseudomonas sp. B21-044]UVM15567.1 phage tail assembly chaperone family protein, TAC [Pseudomonas sp. B21-023]
MNIHQLKALGGIVDSQRVRKEVAWSRPDPLTGEMLAQTLVVHVRRHSFGVIERLFDEQGSSHSRNAHYLAASIGLGEDGEESLSVEDAFNLEPSLGFLLLNAINEVNGTGNTPAKS